MTKDEWLINLEDNEWPLTTIDHDRIIARAIAVDDAEYFYFVRVNRDDEFGKATLIETSGGGVEAGEDLDTAVRRELKEELGVDVDVICKIGVVSDYYHLIRRHNINQYFLMPVIVGETEVRPYLTDRSSATEIIAAAAPVLVRKPV